MLKLVSKTLSNVTVVPSESANWPSLSKTAFEVVSVISMEKCQSAFRIFSFKPQNYTEFRRYRILYTSSVCDVTYSICLGRVVLLLPLKYLK